MIIFRRTKIDQTGINLSLLIINFYINGDLKLIFLFNDITILSQLYL